MLRLAFLLGLPALAFAGGHDFFECTGPDGGAVYSVAPCSRGHAERRIENHAPPVTAVLPAASGGVVKLEKGRSSNFFASARINGVPVRAMVDTGASFVSFGPGVAARLGVDGWRGKPVTMSTANGLVSAAVVRLGAVELNGNRVHNVAGVIGPKDMGPGYDVLLGMSFLQHFEITMDGPVMVLKRK